MKLLPARRFFSMGYYGVHICQQRIETVAAADAAFFFVNKDKGEVEYPPEIAKPPSYLLVRRAVWNLRRQERGASYVVPKMPWRSEPPWKLTLIQYERREQPWEDVILHALLEAERRELRRIVLVPERPTDFCGRGTNLDKVLSIAERIQVTTHDFFHRRAATSIGKEVFFVSACQPDLMTALCDQWSGALTAQHARDSFSVS